MKLHPLLERAVTAGYVGGDERLKVDYSYDSKTRRVTGRARFGPKVSGAPGQAHGGSILAVLDEIMGLAAWMSGFYVMSVRMTTDFRRMLPLGTDAEIEGHVTRARGRKVHTVGRITSPLGLHAEARGLYVVLSPENLERFRKAVMGG